MDTIVLPLMPDQAMGPFSALNRHSIWIIVILVMAIGAFGHIAVRLLGARFGLPIAGLASGFISSTATIGVMGARAVSKVGEGRYVGRRANLIGQAKAEAHGNKIEIAYRARVPSKDGKTRNLNFKEIFVFTHSRTADYRLRVSLLSIPVGEAHLTVRKRPR